MINATQIPQHKNTKKKKKRKKAAHHLPILKRVCSLSQGLQFRSSHRYLRYEISACCGHSLVHQRNRKHVPQITVIAAHPISNMKGVRKEGTSSQAQPRNLSYTGAFQTPPTCPNGRFILLDYLHKHTFHIQ